jgi:hypothetical protein
MPAPPADSVSGVEPPRHDVNEVRSELKRLGYLSDRFDRFLLQDALRPQASARALALGAVRVAVLAGVVLAAVLALALAAVNGNLAATPFDLLPLFVHLLAPSALAAGLAFLLLSLLLRAVLALVPVRSIEVLTLGAAGLAGAAVAALLLARLGEVADHAGAAGLALAAAVAALVVAAVVKVAHAGLLALAVRWTRAAPERRAMSRRFSLVAVLVVAVLLVLPPLLAARQAPPPPPVSLPSAPGERVLLIGVDGVLPAELDYLLAAGDLPAAAGLLAAGGRLFAYRRPAGPPATFWTTVATGLPAPQHGVTAVDSFRPVGMRTPLARSGPLRPYWSGVAVPLGLAEYRPVLANRRSAFTVWELAAHGGAPVAAVNWWSTFPAEALPGLVVAHGAYQLLDDRTAGAVAPPARRDEVRALAVAAAAAGAGRLGGALAPEARELLAGTVLAPDRFYRHALLAALEPRTRAAALYLPGPDIAAAAWHGPEVAFADLLRGELAAADAVLERALEVQRPGLVALVLDPGRRGGGEGRVLLWRAGGCGGAPGGLPELEPRQVASALVRALGLPQSTELPPPPAGCVLPPPVTLLPTFGARHAPSRAGGEAGEYLESLRALGYL